MLLRSGLNAEQIAAAFKAAASSALLAGETAATGIEMMAQAINTGQSSYLNYIGIASNIGPALAKVESAMKGASAEAVQQAKALTA
ncbi:hypothetical protein, partial [Shewanella algae]|uniref:hypothetical protein n=1 Tax=Shewanella algae TaxID=38313 RepID=UPI00313BEABA